MERFKKFLLIYLLVIIIIYLDTLIIKGSRKEDISLFMNKVWEIVNINFIY